MERAGVPRCQRFSGTWIVPVPGVEVAVPLRCRSHRCPWCRRYKSLAATVVIQRGIERAPGRVRLVTLTDPRGDMTSADMSAAWRRFARRLERQGKLGQYVRSLEATKAGALHYHVLLFDTERGGGYIPQLELSRMAEASGFGRVADIREVEGAGGGEAFSVAAYLTKSGLSARVSSDAVKVAQYVTKAGSAGESAEVTAKLGERVRPVTTSRGFIGGSLTETEREICRHFGERSGEAGEAPEAPLPEGWEVWTSSEVLGRLAAHWRRRQSRGVEVEPEAVPFLPREAERRSRIVPARGDPGRPVTVSEISRQALQRAA